MEFSNSHESENLNGFQNLFDEMAQDLGPDYGAVLSGLMDFDQTPSVGDNTMLYDLENISCDGNLLEVGRNVTVFTNSTNYCSSFQPLPSSDYMNKYSCTLSPQSIDRSSPTSDIIVDELIFCDQFSYDEAAFNSSDYYDPTEDASNHSSQSLSSSGVSCDESASSSSVDSSKESFKATESEDVNKSLCEKKKRGRPRKTPDDVLQLLNGKVTKNDKKIIRNNAASIKYRHKIASKFDELKDQYNEALRRSGVLQRRYEKNEKNIETLKLITRSRFT